MDSTGYIAGISLANITGYFVSVGLLLLSHVLAFMCGFATGLRDRDNAEFAKLIAWVGFFIAACGLWVRP